MLDAARVTYSVHEYDYDPDAERIGMQAAESLGVPAGQVLKTLMAEVDGAAVCVLVPSDREVQLKKLAAARSGKSAAMMKPTDAERVTGYPVGGISPFGQKKSVPTILDENAFAHERVFVNGGQRGLQLCLNPNDVVRVLGASVASLTDLRVDATTQAGPPSSDS